MENNNSMITAKSPEKLEEEFNKDTAVVAEQTSKFVSAMQPAYFLSEEEVPGLVYNNSAELLDVVTFFKIGSCSVECAENLQSRLSEKMQKFYTTIHAINKPVLYGIISYNGTTNLVIGVYAKKEEVSTIKSIMQGLLDGVDIEPYYPNYVNRSNSNIHAGFISGVPSVKIGEDRQTFDIGSVMRSLNGQNYSLFFISRPVNNERISNTYSDIIKVRDACFAVSKRNISRQHGTSKSSGETTGTSKTHSHSSSVTKTNGGSFGLSFIFSFNKNWSKSNTSSVNDSISKNYSKTITDAVNNTLGESHDVQNGFALELMTYADKSIERLRQGKINGMWETFISYSAETEIAKQIMEACISGEMAKPNPDLLPAVVRSTDKGISHKNPVFIPKILNNKDDLSKLCTMITSEELGFISTPPSGAVPNFEIRVEKNYPLISNSTDGILVGYLNDGTKRLDNMPFSLSCADLARHTFVCGITGSGKTTTVKRILDQAKTPFLVIESAKTEYRNMKIENKEKLSVYTLGRPEINCISFNPFYIQIGVSPQMHIDLLKDLFNAAFSFYGPMPYILEKCIHNIYKDKGWDLTLGYHPYLANTKNTVDFFDHNYMVEKYKMKSHKYIYPTIQDLKDEVARYVEQEMNYEGEVAGNIKTAIKARLESLCNGAKGYMFNTYEHLDMERLMNEKAVFELEGLADDSDKAFTVGLMVIFVNEYRRVCGCPQNSPLAHLLVIEEAHRLLKNTTTEKTSEDIGNPKGKAVEHFTNMIAEMRSYGQGVIVAEQIPTKLAPDVIKNTSNKIVQRLVAIDDQAVIANTIGISSEDSVQLGTLCTGKALCHKEGMSKPVKVDIIPTNDIKVTDGMLYEKNKDNNIRDINIITLKEALGNNKTELSIQLLNSILIQDLDYIKKSINKYRQEVKKECTQKNISFIGSYDEPSLQSQIITSTIVQNLLRGAYKVKELLSDEFEEELLRFIQTSSDKSLDNLRKMLRKAYGDDPVYKGKYIIAMVVINQYGAGMDIKKAVQNFFIYPDEKSVNEVNEVIEIIKR